MGGAVTWPSDLSMGLLKHLGILFRAKSDDARPNLRFQTVCQSAVGLTSDMRQRHGSRRSQSLEAQRTSFTAATRLHRLQRRQSWHGRRNDLDFSFPPPHTGFPSFFSCEIGQRASVRPSFTLWLAQKGSVCSQRQRWQPTRITETRRFLLCPLRSAKKYTHTSSILPRLRSAT